MWNIFDLHGYGSISIADGYIVSLDNMDNQLICFGVPAIVGFLVFVAKIRVKKLGMAGWTKYDELTVSGMQVHFYKRQKSFSNS